MEIREYLWNLVNDVDNETVLRYCPNCGKKVVFSDSKKRRRNANGKNIYEYAIFKCEKGHTWNKTIQNLKSDQTKPESRKAQEQEQNHQDKRLISESESGRELEMISICELLKQGTRKICIRIQIVDGRWRLDKTLAQQLIDLSRTQIEKKIKEGVIKIDDQVVKANTLLKDGQSIIIDL